MKSIKLLALTALVGCSSGPEDAAQGACKDAIGKKFVGSSVRINGVNQTNDGYLVHATATLTGGIPMKVSCWTRANGSIDEIRVSG